MRMEFSGKNLTLTDALRSKAEAKLGKLERFTGPIVSAHASFEVERHLHRVDLVVHCAHDRIYKAKGMAEDMYVAINDATDAIEQQAKKEKDRRLAGRGKAAGAAGEESAGEEEEEEAPKRRRTAPALRRRNDLFSPKPLSVSDAALLLSEQKDPVLVFLDQETGRLTVVFKDREGRASVVQPPGKG